ncbi:hypothetical protein [Afipia carboxidovorans]|uniref:hypothetical protein n=1 Tax=Afipia carboxidovorans TaxID=40137 RepID=UPI0030CD8F97
MADRLEHQAGNVENDGHLNAARYMREAASALRLAAQSPEPVTVKPLEWPPRCPRGQRVHNRPALVNYTVAHYGGDVGDAIYRWAEAHSPWSDPLPTYEAAKAAAQADYEQRIRSALVNAPAADTGMREALAFTREFIRGEQIESAVVGISSMQSLGEYIDTALAASEATKSDGGTKGGEA